MLNYSHSLIFRLALLLALLPTSTVLAADPGSSDWSIVDDLVSPWTQEQTLLIAGASTTALLWTTRSWVETPAQNSIVRSRPLGNATFADHSANLMGQVVPNAAYFLGYGLAGWVFGDSKVARHRALLMVRATAYASAVTTLLKYTVREPRPENGAKNSFPSGHGTTIGAFAGVILAEEPLGYGIAASALAAFVGLGRINDNVHQIHDVIAGYTLGYSYGLGLSRLDQGLKNQVSWAPIPMPGGGGITAQIPF